MVKKCNVKIFNSECTVVDFDGELIQFPCIKNLDCDFVYVEFNNGKYRLCTENEYNLFINKVTKVNKKIEENKATEPTENFDK